MMKVLKLIGIIILCIVVLIVILLICLSRMSALRKDYIKKIETGGDIEAKYLGAGSYEVSYYEEAAVQVFEKYEIYYPKELETEDKVYPVIVVCNGTGWKASKSKPIYEHYASWGFIVIATEETHSWNAFGAEMCIIHLQRLNDNQMINDKKNVFYQKIDFDNVFSMNNCRCRFSPARFPLHRKVCADKSKKRLTKRFMSCISVPELI